jgi:hypothetical protein
MRFVMIVVDAALREEVEILLRKAGAHGYTELGPAVGWGDTGLRLGSRAFPSTSSVLFSVLDDAAEQQVRIALAGFEEGADRRVRAYAWPVEEIA